MAVDFDIEQIKWLEENNFKQGDYEIIGIKESHDLKKKWRSTFLLNIVNENILHRCPICTADGKRGYSYDWHAFSWKLIEAEEIDENKINEKLKDSIGKLFLIWEKCNTHGLIMEVETIKNCDWSEATDIYIFNETFKWTIVVTHEGWVYSKSIG